MACAFAFALGLMLGLMLGLGGDWTGDWASELSGDVSVFVSALVLALESDITLLRTGSFRLGDMTDGGRDEFWVLECGLVCQGIRM